MTRSESTLVHDYPIQYGSDLIIVKKPAAFAQISEKFRKLIALNPEKLVITNPSSSFDTFQILVRACQCQSFTAHLDDVLELRELAREWMVANLITYCDNFMVKAKVRDIPASQIVDELIEACDNGDKDAIKNCVRHAATKFREVVDDPRIADLPAENIYQLVTSVDIRPYNQDVFIKFVSRLFETDKEAAIPLILRINFDRLSEEQYHIFQTSNEVHEQNINFFTALTMSDIHKSLRGSLKQTDETSMTDLEENRKNYREKFIKIFESSRRNRESDLDKIRMRLVQQNEDLNDLAKVLELQKALLVESVKVAHHAPTNAEYLAVSQEQMLADIKAAKEELLGRVEQDKADAANELEELLKRSQQEIEEAMDRQSLVKPEVRSAVDGYGGRVEEINDRCRKAVRHLYEIRAIVAAKVITDKNKGDKFIRVVDRQWEVLDDPGLFGVKKADAIAAQTNIIDVIEDALDRRCPRAHRRQRQ